MDELRRLYEARELAAAWARYLEIPHKAAEWHLYGALTAWRQNDLYAGKIAIERAFQLYPQGEVRAKCLFTYGKLLRESGSAHRASEEFTECLQLLTEYPDLATLLKGACLYNLALSYDDYGRPRDAVALYEQAADEFDREGMPDYLRQCLQNLAWTALELGDTERATGALAWSEGLCTTEDAHQRQQIVRAYLHEKRQEHTAALQLCEVLHTADAANDVQAFAATIAARITLFLGNVALAHDLADVAVTLSCKPPLDHRVFYRATEVYRLIKIAKMGTGA